MGKFTQTSHKEFDSQFQLSKEALRFHEEEERAKGIAISGNE